MSKVVSLCLFLTIVASCNNSGNGNSTDVSQTDTSKFKFEEVSSQEADSLSEAYVNKDGNLPNDTSIVKATAAGKGASERQWRDICKNVFKNAGFKNPVYFGISSRKGAGTIIDKNQEVIRILEQMVDSNTYNHLLADANSGKLDAANSKGFNFNIFIDTKLLSLDTAISGNITRSDSSILTGGSWEEKDIVWGNVSDLLSSNPSLVSFKQDLNNRKNRLISKVLKVTGFKSEIYTASDIGSELRAKLDSSIVKIPTTNATLRFHYGGKRKIIAETNGYFYVFGIVSKKKI